MGVTLWIGGGIVLETVTRIVVLVEEIFLMDLYACLVEQGVDVSEVF
jgi:predicted RNA-binding protein